MVAEKVEAESSNHQKLEYLLLLAEAQSSALSKTMNEINNFNVAAKITTSEQLYYVKSPIAGDLVLNYRRESSSMFWGGGLQGGFYQNQFNQSELDELQENLSGLNIEALKIPVEDYDYE